jgi:hypothetical protein
MSHKEGSARSVSKQMKPSCHPRESGDPEGHDAADGLATLAKRCARRGQPSGAPYDLLDPRIRGDDMAIQVDWKPL